MVEVIRIGPGEKFNTDQDHVLIQPTARGWDVSGSVALQGAAKFFSQPPFQSYADAEGVAKSLALKHGLTTVYVRRSSDAE
jgi:hypothetical protein